MKKNLKASTNVKVFNGGNTIINLFANMAKEDTPVSVCDVLSVMYTTARYGEINVEDLIKVVLKLPQDQPETSLIKAVMYYNLSPEQRKSVPEEWNISFFDDVMQTMTDSYALAIAANYRILIMLNNQLRPALRDVILEECKVDDDFSKQVFIREAASAKLSGATFDQNYTELEKVIENIGLEAIKVYAGIENDILYPGYLQYNLERAMMIWCAIQSCHGDKVQYPTFTCIDVRKNCLNNLLEVCDENNEVLAAWKNEIYYAENAVSGFEKLWTLL